MTKSTENEDNGINDNKDDNSITNALKHKRYILLDGGTGEELFRRGALCTHIFVTCLILSLNIT